MNNAEDRILRVWTPILLRAILAAAVTLLTVGLLVSVMHSSNDYSSAFKQFGRTLPQYIRRLLPF
jgi:hypothetical protein